MEGAVSQTGDNKAASGVPEEKKVESTAMKLNTELPDRNSPYRQEDWLERHPSGLPQRLLDKLSQIKINVTIPAIVDWTNIRTWFPLRHKVCKATEEEQAKYRDSLDLIFSGDHILGKRMHFSQQLIMDVIDKVHEIIALEPMLIEDLPGDIYVVGDLHGQIHDLWRVMDNVTRIKDSGKKIYEHGRYLFLGNYVDKGNNSLEVVMALFMLKILYPDRFFLLRGHHEFHQINATYGFYEELEERYGEEVGFNVFMAINETFGWLSAAAIIGDKIFCVHGGISPEGFSRTEMMVMRKPFYVSTDDTTLHDLVWSDPLDGLEGIMFNYSRGTSIFYGADVIDFALRKIGCFMMIRGHTMIDEGYQYIWDGRCLTTYSATGTNGSNNHAAFIYVDAELYITPYFMKLIPRYREYIRKCAIASRKHLNALKRKERKEKGEKVEEEEEDENNVIVPYDKEGCDAATGRITLFGDEKVKAK